MRHPFISFFLVFVQFSAFLYIILTSPFAFSSPATFVLFLGGTTLGVWAVCAMRRSRWNIRPDVPERGLLVTNGPYAFIRHPMYMAVLLTAGALFLELPTAPRLVALAILFVNLNIKYRYEEHLLTLAFPNRYLAYRARTKALIPFVY